MIVEMKLSRKQKILIIVALVLFVLTPVVAIYGSTFIEHLSCASRIGWDSLSCGSSVSITVILLASLLMPLIAFILILLAVLPKRKKIKKTRKPPRSS